jgi:thiamine biosynthesis lipoprotein
MQNMASPRKFKKLYLQLIMLAAILLVVFLISRSHKKGEYMRIAGFTQGTTYHITYESKSGEDLKTSIDSILADFDRSLSTYLPASLISRFNKNEPGLHANKKFTDVFIKSYEVFKKTDGAFDITVAPIVNALGFGTTDTLNVDSTMIDSLLQYIGMEKVKLQGDTLVKTDSHVTLDVNALAQGYSVDVVVNYLENRKIKNFMVEIGGEVSAQGRNEQGDYWRIGIDKPVDGNYIPGTELQSIVKLNDRSLATSGNYRKFYEKNGIKYVHTINPKTGYPVISNLLSATVVARDCMTADAYATAFMVMGTDRSIGFLNENRFLDAYLIYSDENGNFKVYCTKGLKRYIQE